MHFRHKGPASPFDRFFGALLGLLLVAITVALAPFALALKVFGDYAPFYPVRTLLSVYLSLPFVVWVAVLSLAGAMLGAMHGTLRVVEFLAHMWGTEQPRDVKFTEQIWVVVLLAWLISFLLASPWHKWLS